MVPKSPPRATPVARRGPRRIGMVGRETHGAVLRAVCSTHHPRRATPRWVPRAPCRAACRPRRWCPWHRYRSCLAPRAAIRRRRARKARPHRASAPSRSVQPGRYRSAQGRPRRGRGLSPHRAGLPRLRCFGPRVSGPNGNGVWARTLPVRCGAHIFDQHPLGDEPGQPRHGPPVPHPGARSPAVAPSAAGHRCPTGPGRKRAPARRDGIPARQGATPDPEPAVRPRVSFLPRVDGSHHSRSPYWNGQRRHRLGAATRNTRPAVPAAAVERVAATHPQEIRPDPDLWCVPPDGLFDGSSSPILRRHPRGAPASQPFDRADSDHSFAAGFRRKSG